MASLRELSVAGEAETPDPSAGSLPKESVAFASASVVRNAVSEPWPPALVACVTPATVNCGSSKNPGFAVLCLAGADGEFVAEADVEGISERSI